MATEVQLRHDRMKTDLKAGALSNSKHTVGAPFTTLKNHVRFAKDVRGSQSKPEPTGL